MTAIQGLSEQEARRRQVAGQGNRSRLNSSRSYAQILRDNAFTFINTVLFAIGAALIAMHQVGNALVTAGLVLLNVVVGVIQEGRAKRKLDQIALLNRPRANVIRDGQERALDPGEIVLGDFLRIRPGDQVVVDGKVVGDGQIEVDESLLTGESDLVPKRAGAALYSGSFCVTGGAVYEATQVGAASYASQLTAGARAFRRVKTPLQQDIDYVIRMMVLLATVLGALFVIRGGLAGTPAGETVAVAAVIAALVPQGLFFMTTVTYATGAVRMAGKGALVQQANAIESMSNVDILCTDKTGTLTTNRILYHDLCPLGAGEAELQRALGEFVASAADRNRTAEAIAAAFPGQPRPVRAEVPFSSARKWSGLVFEDGGTFVLGAPEILQANLAASEAQVDQIEDWAGQGLRVLLFARCDGTAAQASPLFDADGEPRLPQELAPLGLISFSDELRPGTRATLSAFAEAGIRLKIISGDNPQTVAALARQAGFGEQTVAVSGLELAGMDDSQLAQAAEQANVFGRITPEQKEKLVAALRGQGHYVAMVGDGVNDVLSLKQAQLGIAMQEGSQAARAVADIVLLGNSFAALPAAFREGQRIIRGMQDIMRLFLARTFYLTLLIVAAAVVGAPFPVSPRHNFILALLTVGIPTLGLAAWARPAAPGSRSTVGGRPGSSLLIIRHFVLPAALTVALAGFGAYLYGLVGAHDVNYARTVVTTVTVLCGLILIPFVEPPTRAWEGGDELSGDRRPALLALLMLAVYAVLLAVPGLRASFELAPLGAVDLLLAGLLAVIWALALRYIWRHNLVERLFNL